jgi:hypothetical protein
LWNDAAICLDDIDELVFDQRGSVAAICNEPAQRASQTRRRRHVLFKIEIVEESIDPGEE